MQDTFFSKEPKISGIIFCNPVDPITGRKVFKYSHVHNSKYSGVRTFMKQMKQKFPTAEYVNFYSNKSAAYLGRKYFQQ